MATNQFPHVLRGSPVDPDTWYNPVAEAVTDLRAQKIPASGALQSGTAVSTSAPGLTTVYADIPGCTKSITITGANGFVIAFATVLWSCTTLGAGEFFQAILAVDGIAESTGASIVESAQEVYNFRPGSQHWTVPLLAGNHAVKLQAKKSGATSVGSTSNPHCTLSVLVLDIP